MLKIQQVFEIKKCLCVAKAQINFIRSYVNRYSWWNESCNLQFTQLSIKTKSTMKGKVYYFGDLIRLVFENYTTSNNIYSYI